MGVAADQRSRGESTSRVVARVGLAREFVEFFQDHLPMLATSVISIFGAVAMLAWLDLTLGLASGLALALVLVALPAFARRNELLHTRVSDQREREVDVLSKAARCCGTSRFCRDCRYGSPTLKPGPT
jgi:ABC-type multidrug transport system fused ATPase/permease subunit